MKIKIKKLFSLFFAIGCVLFVFSCGTIKGGSEIFVPVDYSEERAVDIEIELIEKLLKENEIKSLWCAKLLYDKISSNEKCKQIFEQTTKTCVEFCIRSNF